MFIIGLFIFGIIMVVLGFVTTKAVAELVIVGGVVLSIVSAIWILIGVQIYASYVTDYNNIEAKIDITTMELQLLADELSRLESTSLGNAEVIFNTDSPYRAMIEARVEIRKNLINLKTREITLKENIEYYQYGFLTFVTYFVDSPLEVK